jgi:hypothetical protein
MNPYRSEAEIENVVRGFENCETDADDFRHPQHLAVAVWYVDKMGRDGALERMRDGLLRFLNHHGVDKGKYSEPITVFWIDKIAAKLEEMRSDVSMVEKCDVILAADFADEGGLRS